MKHLSLSVPLLAVLCLSLTSCRTTGYPTMGAVHVSDPAWDTVIPRGAKLEKVAEGFEWSEGPVWSPEGYLLFSDAPRNTIYKWREGEGISVFMRPSGHAGSDPPGLELGTNGLALSTDSLIIACDHGNRAIVQINTRIWTKKLLASNYHGQRLNSPNDLAFNRKGDIYFTDPPYGLRGINDSPLKELDFNGVYLLRRDGTLVLLVRDLTYPNGIALSPDERTLYVGVSDGDRPVVMAYDVQPDGTVTDGRVFFDGSALAAQGKRGAPDGLTVADNGYVITTGPGGVLILDGQGKLLGTIETGQAVSNVTFGGPDFSTLYITSDMSIFRFPTRMHGLRWGDVRAGSNSAAAAGQR